MNKKLLLVEFLISLGGFFVGVQISVDNELNTIMVLESEMTYLLNALITCVYYISPIVAVILAILIGNKFSRKGLTIVSICTIVGTLIVRLASEMFFSNMYLNFITSLIVNIAEIYIMILVQIYQVEISQPKNRGAYLCLYSLMSTLGSNLGTFLCEPLKKYSIIITIVLGIVVAVILRFVPNSPRWLCLKDRENEATEVLSKLNESTERDPSIKEEIGGIQESIELTFKSVELSRLLSLYLLSFIQQMIGFNYVLTNLYHYNLTPESNKAIMILPLVTILSYVTAMFTIDKIGRKRLLSYGSLIMLVLYIIDIVLEVAGLRHMNLPVLYLSLFIYSATWGIVPYCYVAEVFPIHCRIKYYSVYNLFVYINSIIFSIINAYFFYSEKSKISIMAYILLSFICIVGFIYAKRSVIETKNENLEEIENKITKKSDNNKVENQV